MDTTQPPLKRPRGRPRKYPRPEELLQQAIEKITQPPAPGAPSFNGQPQAESQTREGIVLSTRSAAQVEAEYQKTCAEIGDKLYRRNQFDSEIRELEIKCMALNREYLQLKQSHSPHSSQHQ